MRYFAYCRKSEEDKKRQVLSIPAQHRELQALTLRYPDIEIVEIIDEERSAKVPGRPAFSEMLRRIQKKEADGIIAWAPDRLARNSVDSGWIMDLLDTGRLKDLKFCTYSFENSPQGKFMLGIMFVNSKYFSDALSENVKRGVREKVASGWWPTRAAVGYLNDKATKRIVDDPDRRPLVRRMFELVLSGANSPEQVCALMRDEWGMRTLKRDRSGGAPLAPSSVYRMLGNPFYAGLIRWNGKLYPGKHNPIISISEFDRIQELLGRPGAARPSRHTFAYTGLMRCGECGVRITAEQKRNRHGAIYTYYHCTHRRQDYRCRQPVVGKSDLEKQIEEFLGRVALPESLASWGLGLCERMAADEGQTAVASRRSLEEGHASVLRQIDNLTKLRVRDLVEDGEFIRERQALDRERMRLEQALRSNESVSWFEPGRTVISFSTAVVSLFSASGDAERRFILSSVGSNPTVAGKKLSIHAEKPYREWGGDEGFRDLSAFVQDVRTFCIDPKNKEAIETMRQMLERGEAVPLS